MTKTKQKLPTVVANVQTVVGYALPSQIPANAIVEPDSMNPNGEFYFYIKEDIEVEVLTVHFAKRRMRVRFKQNFYGDLKTRAFDISAEPYFSKYGFS